VQRLRHDHEPSDGPVDCVSECCSVYNPSVRESGAKKRALLREIAPSPRFSKMLSPALSVRTQRAPSSKCASEALMWRRVPTCWSATGESSRLRRGGLLSGPRGGDVG
jgi:hypothetical protein